MRIGLCELFYERVEVCAMEADMVDQNGCLRSETTWCWMKEFGDDGM